MTTFQFNPDVKVCPICGTQVVKEAVLLPIKGIEEENIVAATQVHLDCLLNLLEIYPWSDGRTIIVGHGSIKHFNRADYGITN